MRIQQTLATADRRHIVVNAGDRWDPTSEEAAILVAPFGELIPSPPLLVTNLQDPILNLAHILSDAIVREARLRASIESALYHPLPRELSYLSKLSKSVRIGLVDDKLRYSESSLTYLVKYAQGDWLIINSSGLPIAFSRSCLSLAPRIGHFRRKRTTPNLPLLRYCSLVIGDEGQISRVASLLDKPVVPASRLKTEGIPVTTGLDDLISGHGHGSLIKRRLLSAYPIRYPIDSTQASTEVNRRTPWPIASRSNLTLLSGNDHNNGPFPQCHTMERSLLLRPPRPYSIERYHQVLFKLHRKSRKLVNDPYAFFSDMKIAYLYRRMTASRQKGR